jgi:hypothetical protein
MCYPSSVGLGRPCEAQRGDAKVIFSPPVRLALTVRFRSATARHRRGAIRQSRRSPIRRLCCLIPNPPCLCIPDFFVTCAQWQCGTSTVMSDWFNMPNQVGELCHAEALFQTQASEQSLTRIRVRRISLDGKRCVHLNQRGVGARAEPRNLSC